MCRVKVKTLIITTEVFIMEKIINLTQHTASPEQKLAGVFDLPNHEFAKWRSLITFDSIEEWVGEKFCARMEHGIQPFLEKLYSQGWRTAMIGGAPFFMSRLEKALAENKISALYAFTKRIVEEKDGVKRSVFKHEGFVTS